MNLRDKIAEMQTNGWVCYTGFDKWSHHIHSEASYRIGRLGYGETTIITLREPFGEIHELRMSMDDNGNVVYDIDGATPDPKPEPVSDAPINCGVCGAQSVPGEWRHKKSCGFYVNPNDRRIAAIRNITTRYLDQDRNMLVHNATAESIAAEIRKLSDLGRSEKWKSAVEGWARLVEAPDENLSWALIQGAIWTGFEA